MPLVSVVIATYQRPELLLRAIGSALAQTMTDIEIVVAVENGDQASLLALETLAHPKVRSVVNPGSRGPGPNRDSGIAASLGTWIALLDDDDEWHPEKLQIQLASAENSPTTIVTCQAHVVTTHGSTIMPTTPYSTTQPIDEWLFDRPHWFKPRGSFAQTSTLLVPRTLFDRVHFGASRHDDWEFVIRAVKQHGYTLKTVRQPLVTYAAGGSFSWEKSIAWADEVGDLLSPRAYSGFCLTIATRDLPAEGRTRSALRLLRMAFSNGQPTAKQLLAFALFCAIPSQLRQQAQARLTP